MLTCDRLPSSFGHESVHSWLDRYHSLLLDKFIWNLDNYRSSNGAGGDFQGVCNGIYSGIKTS